MSISGSFRHELKVVDERTHTVSYALYITNRDDSVTMLGYAGVLNICGVQIVAPAEFSDEELARGNSREIELRFSLTPFLLAAIEAERGDGDPTASLSVRLQTFKPGGSQFQASHVNTPPVKISEREWLRVLAQLGHDPVEVITLPVARLEGGKPFEEIATHLREAQEKLLKGEHEQVILSCRKAIETLRATTSAAPEVAKSIDRGSPGEKDFPPKSTRANELRKAVHDFAHTALHTGYATNRGDAELVLRSTIAIASYFGKHSAKTAPQG